MSRKDFFGQDEDDTINEINEKRTKKQRAIEILGEVIFANDGEPVSAGIKAAIVKKFGESEWQVMQELGRQKAEEKESELN